jgi:gluconate 2-dehydrogenase gamma chain
MNRRHAYRYLTPPEVRFLDAAVACLIPADDLGPGAREAGVTAFIDGLLAGEWGAHGRNYRQGPWQEGTPRQGYQSPLAPREVYRDAIRDIDDHCRRHCGGPFHALERARQEDVLQSLEEGTLAPESASSSLFFELLLRNTQEGFFSDPIYGGNQGKIGWRLIGFPGIPSASYGAHIERHGVPYRVEPVGIQDVLDGVVDLDAEGLPRHRVIAPKS